MSTDYDFIIVGGGVAGCLLASRLANASTQPSVLLIEAGGTPTGETLLPPYDRYTPAFTRPDLDYGYTTTAQSELNNRVIPYLRGKGLGGSSILNFMIYLYGSEEDYNRWAGLVGDDSWGWKNVKETLKKIENFHISAAGAYSKYANPKLEDHGQEGSVDVCLPNVLERGADLVIDAGAGFGYPRNLDLNSGNPVGIGIFPASYFDGKRTTSATAHLPHAPKNLVIWTNSPVVRVIFKNKQAVGVELENGQQAFSRKEVILTAGAFDTAKLLLLSGIGPSSELQKHNIDIVHELPGVGKNLQDHPVVFINVEVDSILSEKYSFESDPIAVQQARELWAKDQSGPLSHHNGTVFGAFLKLPALETFKEFKLLDSGVQEYMAKPAVPAFEFAFSAPMLPPSHELSTGRAYLSSVVILMNPQSRGQVTLSSGNPKDAPLIDPGYLTHAFDKKAMLESIKETMNFVQNSALGKYFKGYILGPKSSSDEHIENFMKEQVAPLWHANGTVMMGESTDPNACVDQNFRVRGVSNLRVADLSICPFTPNNHPQSTAYLVGYKAATAIIEQWNL